jgi:hypothetical protein
LFNNEEGKLRHARRKFYARRDAANLKRRLDVRLPRELSLSQTPANLLSVGFGQEVARVRLLTPLPRPLEQSSPKTSLNRPARAPASAQPPSMDSESEHEHRDDESLSEQEEVEEIKPKSALKKAKEVVAPVERPQLP